MLGDQAGDVADASDVGVAVFLAEAEALGQVRANLVAVQERAVAAELGESLDGRVGDGALARAREPGEPERDALAEPRRIRLVQDLGDGRPAEPLGELQALGEVLVADIGAGDVGRLDAGGHLVDGRVAVLVGKVDHLLEIDHPHADLSFVLGHRLLGGIGGVERLAGRVFAGPGVVAADDEIGAAVVAPDDRVQQAPRADRPCAWPAGAG